MSQLSHEAYKVAWDTRFWARHDLRFAAFRPTALDYEALGYLDEITRRVPWIARMVEKNSATARISSKPTHDAVAYETRMFRLRYQPASFRASTNTKVEHLLNLLDEIAPYYAQNLQPETLKETSGKSGN